MLDLANSMLDLYLYLNQLTLFDQQFVYFWGGELMGCRSAMVAVDLRSAKVATKLLQRCDVGRIQQVRLSFPLCLRCEVGWCWDLWLDGAVSGMSSGIDNRKAGGHTMTGHTGFMIVNS